MVAPGFIAIEETEIYETSPLFSLYSLWHIHLPTILVDNGPIPKCALFGQALLDLEIDIPGQIFLAVVVVDTAVSIQPITVASPINAGSVSLLQFDKRR
jgi:hypothetical protein